MLKLLKKLTRKLSAWAWRKEINVCDGLSKLKELNMDEAGIEMAIQTDPALAKHIATCFVSLVADSPNYTEMMFDIKGSYLGKYEWVTVTVQKGSGKSPHELRRQAETERDDLRRRLNQIS